MKYVIWGLGAVGSSFLLKIIENNLFNPEIFYCVDSSQIAKEKFIILGGKENHFKELSITQNNIKDNLEFLEDGDYLFDFAINIKNLDILEFCLKNNIHYFSTADSSYENDLSWTSVHQHYLEYLKIKKKYKNKQNTCLILFGMNPGLVSSFVIMCLKEIIDNDNGIFVSKNREKLKKLIKKEKYALLCKKLKVEDIQEIDNDDQITNIEFKDNVCYSTWNVFAYYYETISSPEIAFGNREKYYGYKKIYDCDSKDLSISLFKSGYEYKEYTYSPQGMIYGHISTHEEIFTIRNYLTCGNYKPTVHFIYSPCSYAIKSIEKFKFNKPINLHLITKNEIIDGGESVGVIIQGKNFKSRYYGNYLKTNDLNESATILQVSASAFAGFIYILNHPKEGLLFPEEVDSFEVLDIAKKYLKNYINVECPKINMTYGKNVD